MYTGMILTAFVSWFISFAAFFASFNLFTRSKGKRVILAFAGFWLTVGILWFLAGLRLWFAWLGRFDIDQTIFTIDQVVVLAQFLTIPYFAARQWFTKEKINIGIAVIFAIITLIGVFFLFTEGIEVREITYFASKYSPNKITFTLFAFMLIVLVISLFISSMKEIIHRVKKIPIPRSFLLANSSVLLYATIGLFDERGLVAGWPLVFFRLFFILAAILAYLSFEEKK